MRRSLAIVLVLCLLPAAALAQERDGAGESAMLAAINARRAAQGLGALARDPRLDSAAAVHSAEMAAHSVLEHVSAGSGTPADRVHAAGLPISEIAENVAMHATTAQAQTTLEASDAHLANMLGPRFTHVGLASVRSADGFYVTQVFGHEDPEPAAPPAAALVPPTVAPAPAIVEPAAPVVPTAPATATVVVPPAAPAVVGAPATATVVSPGVAPGAVVQGPTPTVVVPGPDASRPVQGYWVCSSGRWWYYPMPPGAAPGQQLQADTSVVGAPAGYSSTMCAGAAQAQPLPPPMPMARPQVWMPRPPPRRMVVLPPQRRRGRVLVMPPPPPRPMIVAPPPGAVIAPYGGGAVIELGVPGFSLRGSVR